MFYGQAPLNTLNSDKKKLNHEHKQQNKIFKKNIKEY